MRFKLALVIIGGVLVFFGIQESRLASGAKAEPQKITCAELLDKGAGENAHIILTDYFLPVNLVVYTYDKSNPSHWSTIYVPAVPKDGEYAAQCLAQIAAGQEPAPPTNVKLIVKSSKVNSEAAMNSWGNKTEVQGLLVNKIESIGTEEKKLLSQGYPGSNFETCLILEEGRKPAGTGQIVAFFAGGIVCAVLGLVLMIARKG